MAPHATILINQLGLSPRRLEGTRGSWRENATEDTLVTESWGQGFLVGALLMMACITISNMRAGVFLHKMILLELFLAMSHGTFCFMSFDGYGWYLSATAALLYLSWIVHNLVAWLKIKPFLTERASWIFIGTICLTVAPIILQIVNNFLFFNQIHDLYVKVRAYEVLMRDPWWVFACILFFYVIKTRYTVSIRELINGHPRFVIMLLAMILSIIFTVVDILSNVIPSLTVVTGINPYWKIALVFKALTDVIILDDFKTCLDKLRIKLIDSEIAKKKKPPPVPPKDFQNKGKTATFNSTTTRSSPTLVSGESPRTSPRSAMRQTAASLPVQRSRSIRDALGRIGTHLSPLPSMEQMRDEISPSELSPRSGSHTIHIKMDFGLSKFVSNVAGRRPPSMPAESPLDPTWPRAAGLRRGLSVLSNGALSSNPRSSRTSVPALPERTPTKHESEKPPSSDR